MLRLWIGCTVLLFLLGCSGRVQEVPQTQTVVIPLNPAVQHQVRKYEKFLRREVCFNLGCDKSPTLFAQVHQESRWKETAQSKFASGLTQFTPDTATWINQLYASDLKELCPATSGCPLDPKWALRAMTLYMKRLYMNYTFPPFDDHRLAFALAAYNGGAGWIPKERTKAHELGLNNTLWFGGVDAACIRADWACKENRHYPQVILYTWRPQYQIFLNGGS